MRVSYLNCTSVVRHSVYAAHEVCRNRAKTTAQLEGDEREYTGRVADNLQVGYGVVQDLHER